MGRVYQPKYAWTNGKGERIERTTKAWYIEYFHNGRTIRRKAGVTKEQARDALRKVDADILAERNGVPMQRLCEMLVRELADAYLEALQPLVCASHYGKCTRVLKRMLALTKARNMQQLTPESVDAALGTIADKGVAARTINAYLVALKAMLNWAVKRRKLPYNPIACIQKRAETKKARVRRPLTPEELSALITAALDGPRRRAELRFTGASKRKTRIAENARPMTQEEISELARHGRQNALIYTMLAGTGLRLNELRNLRWSDVNLDAAELTTRAEWSKNRRQQTIPLPPHILQGLCERRLQEADSELVVPVSDRLLRQFKDDLEAAKIRLRDARGHTVDLHALRHTYGTMLINSGADIKSVQTLMRHSSPVLTLGIYLHSDKGRLRNAVANLPAPTQAKMLEPAVAANT